MVRFSAIGVETVDVRGEWTMEASLVHYSRANALYPLTTIPAITCAICLKT
jgi:hypothetical protein